MTKHSCIKLVLAVAAGVLSLAASGRAQTAAFAGIDTTTQGAWTGRYGHDGYSIAGGSVSTPAYSGQVSLADASPFTWETVTAQGMTALQEAAAKAAIQPDVDSNNTSGNNAVGTAFNVLYAQSELYKSASLPDRIASMWYNTASTPGSSLTIDVPIHDSKPHQVALYFLDHDSQSRFETIQVESAATGAILDTHRMSYFVFGQYLIWNVTGPIKFVVTQDSGRNAVVSGVFFDPPAPRPAVTLGEINVAQYGAAGNGITDNTSAFQRALNAAGRTGAIVKVPAGRYSFDGTLTVPAQVVIEGVSAGERGAARTGPIHGTVFLIRGGAGGSIPFLSLNANSAVREITFFYPGQPLSTVHGWQVPTPYPPTIYLGGDNATVDTVCGVNPYIFIVKSLDGSSVRTNVRHAGGQPLFRGLVADADPDVTHYEDIHFGPLWDTGPAMAAYMLANSYGFAVYRGDDLKFTGCSASGYERGFYFGISHLPTTVDLARGHSGPYTGGLQDCTGENCRYGLWIDASKQDTDIDLHGCAFSSNLSTDGAAVMIAKTPDTNGNVTFEACRFWQAKGPLFINRSGAGACVVIAGCSFDAWGTQSAGLDPSSAAILCGDFSPSGVPGGKTLITNCTFNKDQYAYASAAGVQGVLFDGNTTVNGSHVQAAP